MFLLIFSFEKSIYSVEISEKASINSSLVELKSKDADIGPNGEISYSFSSPWDFLRETFEIEEKTGKVKVRSPLDFEKRSSYLFYAKAEDSGKERRSSRTLINVTILDENESAPRIEFRFSPWLKSNSAGNELEISENESIEKFFVEISIVDEDRRSSNVEFRLDFRLFDSNSTDEFQLERIDSSRFFFKRLKNFDSQLEQIYRITFSCEDFHGNRSFRTEKKLTIRIIGENRNRSTFVFGFRPKLLTKNPISLRIETKRNEGTRLRLNFHLFFPFCYFLLKKFFEIDQIFIIFQMFDVRFFKMK